MLTKLNLNKLFVQCTIERFTKSGTTIKISCKGGRKSSTTSRKDATLDDKKIISQRKQIGTKSRHTIPVFAVFVKNLRFVPNRKVSE